MTYVDGFVIPVPESNIETYRSIAQQACKLWIEHGALDYKECVADDMNPEFAKGSFPKAADTKDGETVVFAFITFKSREHRDEVNAKVHADPRLMEICDPKDMPFDCNRMAYGGFKTIVTA